MCLKSDMHFALEMQCLFSSLILNYKNEHIMQFISNFLRLLDAPLFEECTGVCCETPRSCCLGVFLISHGAQCADSPCWGSSWGLDNALIPVLFCPVPLLVPTHPIPSFSPTPTRQSIPGERRERVWSTHPPKGSARHTIIGSASTAAEQSLRICVLLGNSAGTGNLEVM